MIIFFVPKHSWYFGIIFIAGVLHFTGFLSAMYVFRIADNEQLQNLVERVFILHNVPNKLIFSLWMQIINGVLWLLIMTLYLIVMEDDNIDTAKIVWLGESTKKTQIIAKILLVAVTFVQDLVQVIVLTSYSLQCYLLRRYVYILKGKLLQNTIDSLDWMRVSFHNNDHSCIESLLVFTDDIKMFVHTGNGRVSKIVIAS